MNATQNEKAHFDQISSERQNHGFIPDLERMTDCDYFYLSPFRRKALANLALRGPAGFMVGKLAAKLPRGAKVLDLGCGSGWFSLELARAGFQVTSVDLSESSIALARETLKSANLGPAGGSVTYHCADLNTWTVDSPAYAAVCYMGSLHHLENPAAVVSRVKAALPPKHLMVADEPLPNNYGDVEAAIGLLVRGVLSACGAWYEPIALPKSDADFAALLNDVKSEYQNWADKKEGQQSPMNNSSAGDDNLAILQRYYDVQDHHDVFALQHRLIGGIRLPSDEQNLALAQLLTRVETLLLAQGVLKPGSRAIFGVARP